MSTSSQSVKSAPVAPSVTAETIGARVREAMDAGQISTEQLAASTGYTIAEIYEIANGQVRLSDFYITDIFRIAGGLDVCGTTLLATTRQPWRVRGLRVQHDDGARADFPSPAHAHAVADALNAVERGDR